MQRISPWTSLLAVLISLGALTISWLGYSQTVRNNRLTVRPYVRISAGLEGPVQGREGKNGIYLANLGLGPAILKGVWVEDGKKSYNVFNKQAWEKIIQEINSWQNDNISPMCFKLVLVEMGSVIKVGDENPLISPTQAKRPECQMDLLKLMLAFSARPLKIRVQYESMYGDPSEAVRESWFDKDALAQLTETLQKARPSKP